MKIKIPGLIALLITGSLTGTSLHASQQKILETQIALEQEKSVRNIYRAYFPNKKLARKAVITFHNNLMESNYEQGYLVFELDTEDMQKLEQFGFRLAIDAEYIERRDERLTAIQNRLQADEDQQLRAIPGYPCYETVEETLAEADNMVSQYPNLAEFIDVGDSWAKSVGDGGYDIKVLVLTNKNTDGDKPILFVKSAIHAREYTTAPLNLDFARWLINGYGNNADATWLLDHQEVHLMLQANPDGRKQAEAGLSWRKNYNQNFCSFNQNSRGVDLNRNFSFKWNVTNGSGSSGNECNQTFRGPSAGSEPEIQAIENYVRRIWPDRRGENDNDAAPRDTTGIHIDLHSFSELVLWPWGSTNAPAPNGADLQTLGRKFAFFNNYEPTQSIGLYPTDGTSDNVSYGELGVAAYTFELGTRFFQNCNTYENSILPDNLPALIYAAKAARAPYIMPSGPDVDSLTVDQETVDAGTPVTITATVSDLRFNNQNGTEATQNISAAEYYIDKAPWESGATPFSMAASDGSFNEKTESVSASINTSNLTAGRHIVYVRAKDTSNTFGAVTAVFLDIAGEPPLAAKFAYNCTGLQCQFDSSSSSGSIEAYNWDFGDGNTSTITSPVHVFAEAGVYDVTLTVISGDASESQTQSVTVQPAPPVVAKIAFVCDDLSCDFDGSDSSGTNLSFSWDFGDGTGATGSTTQHQYDTAGSYTVLLSVSNGIETDTTSVTVSVTAPPPPAIELTLSSGSFFFFSWVNVEWAGATSNSVDIYRNGSPVTTTTNDGSYRDFISQGTYTYRVCEAGTQICSEEKTISI